jgi:tRNA G10  N-methylase Trm11
VSSAAPCSVREKLERRWHARVTWEPELADWVTARGAIEEPFHRWFRFTQGFSPQLVRRFLADPSRRGSGDSLPVLDPFSGSGTTVVECGRRGVNAVGFEASAALVYLHQARSARGFPPLPDRVLELIQGGASQARATEAIPETRSDDLLKRLAAVLEDPVHRCALMLAADHATRSAARPNPAPLRIRDAFQAITNILCEDLANPLSLPNRILPGDARRLEALKVGSVGAILTSPPYLSRHHYARILKPLERVYRLWDDAPGSIGTASRSLRSVPRNRSGRAGPLNQPETVIEVQQALVHEGHADLAPSVADYFEDFSETLAEFRRVLVRGGPCWIVLGGARVKGVYVPSDLIAAEMAESLGFRVERLMAVRRLIESGRKLGTLDNISPRESILVLT